MEQPSTTESEPKKKEELKGHFETSHSPFGFVWQIAAATGWTVDYILWGVNYQTLLMMLADAPRYIDKEDAPKKDNDSSSTNKNSVLGFFQSKLDE